MELLVSRWSVESHIFIAVWGNSVQLLEDVAILTTLPLYKERNGIDMALGDNDTKKLRFTYPEDIEKGNIRLMDSIL